jgi:ABC-2 type transport system ATP-binding protein
MGISREKIYDVLELVDLKNTGKKLASQFSMGMKQRLGIAIALIGDPELLILDEPTNGLDPVGIQELRELICSFPKRGITVLLSSHILSEVSQIVDNIGIISEGMLKYQGEIDCNEDLEKLFMSVVKGGLEND